MKTGRFVAILSMTLLAMLCSPLPTAADPMAIEPQRQGDVRFLSGGVGDAEQEAVRQQAGDYNLWLTLTRPDGAYLSRVDVRIQDESAATVLQTMTRGPFLLARLEPGRYRIRAAADDWHTERRIVDVPATGQGRVFIALEEQR